MANTMSFEQVATVLNSIQQQATGQAALTATDTSSFISCANTTLATGMDPVMNAINQVLTRTIFSVRPYSRKFGIVEVPESAYGNHIRKLQIADKPVEDDAAYKWPAAYDGEEDVPTGDGSSVDPWDIKKADVLQTNFYGKSVFMDHITIFREQLESAFRGPEELGSFLSMVLQNMTDKLEQNRENLARACVANFIGGLIDENDGTRVIKLLTEYNSATGLSLTAQTVMQPANYRSFIQWAFARIMTISEMMTERSLAYQTVVNSKAVMHHTPKADQKMMIWTPASMTAATMAEANTYHDELLRLGAYENVNFWQSIKTPDSIKVKPSRIGSNGSVVTAGSALTQAGIFGLLFDREALGYAVCQQHSDPTPYNPKGMYSNLFFHEQIRLWNDHSEKGVVFLLA